MCEQEMSIRDEKKRQIYLQALTEIVTQLGNGYWLAKDENEYWSHENARTKKGVCIGVCLHAGFWSIGTKKCVRL